MRKAPIRSPAAHAIGLAIHADALEERGWKLHSTRQKAEIALAGVKGERLTYETTQSGGEA
jgi:hypothetical protein